MSDLQEVQCKTSVYLNQISESRKFVSLQCHDFGIIVVQLFNQGAGKRPRQCCPKGLKTKEKATRGPEGPESG